MTSQIIPPDFYEWFLKKHPRIFIGCVLFFCFVIVPVVHVAVNKEWFKRKAIEIKYCYHWDGDTIQSFCRYNKGNRINCFEKAYWMLAYYYTPDSLFPDIYRPVIENSDFGQLRSINKVEVLCYSEDSLLAKIRYNYPTSGSSTETVCIVPTFTLHDTLPTGYEAENEGYMKDIKLKKPKS